MSIPASFVPPSVLCFGCADATSGGGIQCDVLTVSSMACHPLSVLGAVTIRDTRGLEEVLALDSDTVVAQARAVLEDVPVRAFRVGMMASVENLAAIAEVLSDYPDVPLVLEPALFHLDGNDGMSEEYSAALVELLLPLTSVLVIGPHDLTRLIAAVDEFQDDFEDEMLEGDLVDVVDDPQLPTHRDDDIARLIGFGVEHILLTGAGDPGPKLMNTLFGVRGRIRSDEWVRLGGHYLGARATLAAAISAALAHGMDMPEACREAQEFVWQSLSRGYRIGMGLALPDRLFWARDGGLDEG